MARASFLQSDIERVIRAARKQNAVIQFDLKTLIFTIFPTENEDLARNKVARQGTRLDVQGSDMYAKDGKENWD